MLASEMDSHLGYNKYERSSDVDNYRNGTKLKRVRSKYGEQDTDVPQDRQSSFEQQLYHNVRKIFPRLMIRLCLCM